MLNQIRDKLQELIKDTTFIEKYGVIEEILYGTAHKHDNTKPWNYIVFNKEKLKKGGTSLTDLTYYWNVAIIHEEYIPEGLEEAVIDKIQEIKGLRLADGDMSVDYMTKGESNMVVELLQISFVKTKKRCDV